MPAPLTIYEGIYKLPPGTLLRINGEFAANLPAQKFDAPIVFWTIADVIRNGSCEPITDEVEAIDASHHRLSEAVTLQPISDVPLEAFLSGGVDSSTIVALMQAQSSRPVQTFTVGFEEAGFDESPSAAAVAEHLGTDNHALLVTSWGSRIWNKVGWIPPEQRRWLGAAVQGVSVSAWDALGRLLGKDRLADRAHKLGSRLLGTRDSNDVYWSIVTEWPGGDSMVKGLSHAESLDEMTAQRSVPTAGLVGGCLGRSFGCKSDLARRVFDPGPIRKARSEHLSGQRDWAPRFWTVLMFQAWFGEQSTSGNH